MIWQWWLEGASTALSMTIAQAGIFLSLAVIASVNLGVAIATRGQRILESSSLATLLLLILFTYMQWLPLWTGSALALVVALFIAKYVGKWI